MIMDYKTKSKNLEEVLRLERLGLKRPPVPTIQHISVMMLKVSNFY